MLSFEDLYQFGRIIKSDIEYAYRADGAADESEYVVVRRLHVRYTGAQGLLVDSHDESLPDVFIKRNGLRNIAIEYFTSADNINNVTRWRKIVTDALASQLHCFARFCAPSVHVTALQDGLVHIEARVVFTPAIAGRRAN